MRLQMRIIFLLASLSGIYAHPLEEVDANRIGLSNEKLCGTLHCALPAALLYPAGHNAKNCSDGTYGHNQFAIGLAPAGKKKRKRSIIPTTHTKYLDSLEPRSFIACPDFPRNFHVTNFPGPSGHTPEVTLRNGSRYLLGFSFNVIVDSIAVWIHHADGHYRKIQERPFYLQRGFLATGRFTQDANVHFTILFRHDRVDEATFREGPMHLHITGSLSISQIE